MITRKTYKVTYREKGNPNAEQHFCFIDATSAEVAKFSFGIWQSREFNNQARFTILAVEKVQNTK